MEFTEFLAEFKSDLQQYDSANLIEDMDIHRWVIEGMNRFGNLSTVPTSTVILINNRKGKLPTGFKSLKLALKCESCGCECEEENKDILLDSFIYSTKSTTDVLSNICKPCDREIKESYIEEKVYLRNGAKAKMYYNDLKWLKLVSYSKRDVDLTDCPNLNIKESPYEISINNGMMYTNFTKGNVYITYKGYPIGDDDFVLIPDSKRGHLQSYLEYYCKRKFMEKIMGNGDSGGNEVSMLQYYNNLELQHFANAKVDLKFKDMDLAIEGYKESLKKQSKFTMYNFG